MKIEQRTCFVLILFALLAFSLFAGGCSSGDSSDPDPNPRPNAAQKKVDEGQAALEAGDYNTAVSNLAEADALAPNDPEIRTLRATAYASRAGVSVDSLTESLTDHYTDGSTALAPAPLPKIIGLMNYADPGEFAVRTMDTGKALDLMVAGDPTLASLGDEDRATVGALAMVHTLQQTTLILEGNSPARLTDAEIETLVSANYADHQEGLNRAVAVAAHTRGDLIAAMTDPLTELVASGEVETLLADYGMDDGEVTEQELLDLLQGLNDPAP